MSRKHLFIGDLISVCSNLEPFENSALSATVQVFHGGASVGPNSVLFAQTKKTLFRAEKAFSRIAEENELACHFVVHAMGETMERVFKEMQATGLSHGKKFRTI